MFKQAAIAGVLGVAAMGCMSDSAPKAMALTVPAGTPVAAYGRMDTLYLPPSSGSLYFVDDQTGQVVYVMTLASVDRTGPVEMANLPASVRKTFDPAKYYRVYVVDRRGWGSATRP